MNRSHLALSLLTLCSLLLFAVCGCESETPAPISESHPTIGDCKPLTGNAVAITSETLTIRICDGIALELVQIPAGVFVMGSDPDEGPAHKVTISRSFYMGKYEVTQAQWKEVMGENPSHFRGDDGPVESVSWDDCREFCSKLSELSGYSVRLPTEAEWEYTCRAGSGKTYCFGDAEDRLGDYAWHSSNSGDQTREVGGKLPNAWGLYDMHGNVWEWCNDRHSNDYGDSSPKIDPTGASSGRYRALRGGGWGSTPEYCGSAYRNGSARNDRGDKYGFRCCVDSHRVATVTSGEIPVLVGETASICLGDGVALDLVRIPAGKFIMGTDKGNFAEGPAHVVMLSQDFYMSKYEVTQAQWREIMGGNPSQFKGDDRPVERVAQEDCREFCRKVSRLTGLSIRLPSEAEWEYACRAGTNSEYGGSGNVDEMGWHNGNSGLATHSVGTKMPNAWGLHDMHGNVWEWCEDGLHQSYEGSPRDGSPWLDDNCVECVRRGGAWGFHPMNSRSACRSWRSIDGASSSTGFRVVVTGAAEDDDSES